jgi:hypothetical protein
MIDPKGSRLESAAMAIIRADRAKKHLQHIVLSPDSEGAKSNVETGKAFLLPYQSPVLSPLSLVEPQW